MPIAMTNGITYENSLDMLFAKDMPSREETQGKMPAVDMPKRLPQPNTYTPNEEDQLSNPVAPAPKLQNDPYSWGMRGALDETGAAKVPNREPKFHEIMDQADYLINPEKIQARPQDKESFSPLPDNEWQDFWNKSGSRQLLQGKTNSVPLEQSIDNNPMGILVDKNNLGIHSLDKDKYEILEAPDKGYSNQFLFIRPKTLPAVVGENDSIPPNARPTSEETPPEKSTYEKITEALSKIDIHPSFAPRPEVFAELPWKEKLGSIIATTFMAMGPGRGVKGPGTPGATPLKFWTESLAELDKIEHPVINTLRTAEKEGSQTAANLLETYKKIDDPVVRAEFSKIVKDKINSASEGGENAPSDITNPDIHGDWTPKEMKALKGWVKEGFPEDKLPAELGRRSYEEAGSKAFVEGLIKRPVNTENTPLVEKFAEHQDRVAEMLKAGKTNLEISKETGLGDNTLKKYIAKNPDLNEIERPPRPNTKWSPVEDKILKDWAQGEGDLFETPKLLKHRSETSIFSRARDKGWLSEDVNSAKPFVPKGAVSAPEKGSGSGGEPPTMDSELQKIADHLKYNQRRETELEGKSGIGTPNTIPEDAANQNKSLQIRGAEEDAILDKMWKNMGVALEKGIPPISPVLEAKMNPVGKQNLRQFELQMDYKYKEENRGWIHKLTDEEVSKYKQLINRATFRNEKNIKNSIQRMLNPEPDK